MYNLFIKHEWTNTNTLIVAHVSDRIVEEHNNVSSLYSICNRYIHSRSTIPIL